MYKELLEELNLKHKELSLEDISKFENSEDFIEPLSELFQEIIVVIVFLSNLVKKNENGGPKKWNTNEAITGGLLVRLSKLCDGYLDSMIQNRLEIAHILSRCIFETIVNISYLITFSRRNKSDIIFDDYRKYSLREEKKLLNIVEKNIQDKGFADPIEARIKESILSSFKISGFNINEIDENDRSNWGESIFKRAKYVELTEFYLTFMGLTSHHIHGNWQDLLTYHLEIHEDGFLPKSIFHTASPKLIASITSLCTHFCKTYIEKQIDNDHIQKFLLEKCEIILIDTINLNKYLIKFSGS